MPDVMVKNPTFLSVASYSKDSIVIKAIYTTFEVTLRKTGRKFTMITFTAG